ncbi:PrsW family glutamic-type intramembrane protease [Thermosynechococcus sp. QS41]|uniref:PrsW family glutamic-type intramembrane protease n=1 Tax=Thermosynechococcus sp. QS41 TaxID=3074101 RepID=UPI002877F4D9|nr:PrsW family glutamic-type intramembrane protease [Thermosynechococcus sp. QS41]WNC60913.1 PrsW family glutamic-type intramembrane protease [Thermosynechococcus sp. QS41]
MGVSSSPLQLIRVPMNRDRSPLHPTLKYAGVLRQVSPEMGQFWLSQEEVTIIGRDPATCHIVLDAHIYTSVSRHHAQLTCQKRGSIPVWAIADLGSVNGTYVNQQRVQTLTVLNAGDRIQLGRQGPEFVLEYLPLTEVVSTQPDQPLTLTQLLPIFAIHPDWVRKAYLVPGTVTVVAVILLFATAGSPDAFKVILALYLGSAAYYFIYQLCGKRKPAWVLLGTLTLEMLILQSPILPAMIYLFRTILPGQLHPPHPSFWVLFSRNFIGAGLMEELLKALPIVVAYGLGRWLPSPWKQKVGVWEPLDGILLGAAAGLGFTWIETLGQYVPSIAGQFGNLAGLQVLIPRVLGSLTGHMAYTGYLGYCVGLSVLRPHRAPLILMVGLGLAAFLHALWNTAAARFGPMGLAVVGILAYVFLTAAILKARQLSPTRSQNFATRFYGYR